MSVQPPTACERFDANAEDLALGHTTEPLRAELLAHAATCASCRALLDGLVSVTDRLLLLAPEVEPPAGFEGRVMDRLAADTPTAPRQHRRWMLAAAAVILVAGAFVAGWAITDEQPVDAAIVDSTGDEVGTVSLVADPVPHVLITVAAPRPGPGVRVCELQDGDGTWREVGSWEAADIYSGVWAAGIPDALLDATAMRITSDGDVVATARFD